MSVGHVTFDGLCVSLTCDVGSLHTRFGLNVYSGPRLVIPSTVAVPPTGHIRYGTEALATTPKEYTAGCTYPNMTSDPRGMSRVIKSIIDKEGFGDGDSVLPLVVVPPSSWTESQRTAAVAALFEEIEGLGAVHIARPAVAHVFAAGLPSGVVVESGHQSTSVTGVFEGYALLNSVSSMPFGGRDVAKSLKETCFPTTHQSLVPLWAVPASTIAYWEDVAMTGVKAEVADILEKRPVFPLPADWCEKRKTKVTLPDGTTLDITASRFLSTEQMFSKDLTPLRKVVLGGGTSSGPATNECIPIQHLVENTLSKCDADTRGAIAPNIICCGGNSLLRGFCSRLQFELGGLCEKDPNVTVPSQKTNSAWVGASIMAAVSSFQQLYITRDDLKEYGVENSVKGKCA